MRETSRSRWSSLILPISFVAAVLVFCTGALLVIGAVTQRNIGAVDLGSQDLKVRLDELRATLQLLIVAAGLFAIAQGAAAFFNAQTFTKQADDAVKRIQDQARDAESRYPMFARTEAVRRESYASLADIFRDPYFLDWRISAYERLDLLDRQKLLSVERFIGIELIPHPGGPEEYVRDLRRLANFYASKHRYDTSKAQAHWTDLERSEYYLKLAIRETRDEAYDLITDLGVLYMEFHSPRRLDEAEERFQQSLKINGDQQRAHYNRGVAARYRNRLGQAVQYYDDALRHTKWERRALPEMHCAIYYNRACALARYSYQPGVNQTDSVAECIRSLHEAAGFGLVATSVLQNDLTNADGAFAQLDPAAKKQIAGLGAELTTPKTTVRPRQTWRKRLKKAFDALRGRA